MPSKRCLFKLFVLTVLLVQVNDVDYASQLFRVSSRSSRDQVKHTELDLLGTTEDVSAFWKVPRQATKQLCLYQLASVKTALVNIDNEICSMECELSEEVLVNNRQTSSLVASVTFLQLIHKLMKVCSVLNLQCTAYFKFLHEHFVNDPVAMNFYTSFENYEDYKLKTKTMKTYYCF